MTRVTLLAGSATLWLVSAAPAAAQTDSVPSPTRVAWSRPVAHYGKWLTAATAVALTWMGAREHASSEEAWDHLLKICRANSADCALGSDGRYLNAIAEQYYQTSLRYDRRARVRLLAGQSAVLVTVGLFVLDRRHRKNGPANIPLPSLELSGDPQAGGARVGVRWTF